MAAKYSHELENGYTFLASTLGSPGGWAKATDPITAVKKAVENDPYRNTGSKGNPAQCLLVKNGEAWIDEFDGSVAWNLSNPPIPIGLFLVTKGGSVKPMPKNHFNDRHDSHEEWIVKMFKDVQTQDEYYKKVKDKETKAA